MADVRDILEISLDSVEKKKSLKRSESATLSNVTPKKISKKGINREVYALLSNEDKKTVPLISTDFPLSSKVGFPAYGYKTPKVNLSLKKVRRWTWTPFTNPARKDGFQLYHWRHEADQKKEYPFAKFNVQIDVPTYTDQEFQELLQSDDWSKQETDYLFDLCRKFDCRFLIVHDRWDENLFKDRDVEALKERYYSVCCILEARRNVNAAQQFCEFDAEHERKRKAQLRKLYERTPEEVAEEEELMAEMKKIELRRKERDKKTQDLQKLITASDSTPSNLGRNDLMNQSRGSSVIPRTGARKKLSAKVKGSRLSESGLGLTNVVNSEPTGIKFPESKSSGVWLRSTRMKLPSSVGQKRTKAIEQVLQELGVDPHPMPTEEIVREFNELRSDMVLLYELKSLQTNLDYELQALIHQYEAATSNSTNTNNGENNSGFPQSTPKTPLSAASLPEGMTGTFGTNTSVFENPTPGPSSAAYNKESSSSQSPVKKISEIIDVTNTTPRRRKAAMDWMRKISNKNL